MARWRSVGASLLAIGLAAGRAVAEPVQLGGAWHVLIHYTDASTNKPEQPRWDDRLWLFEREGDALRWTEYPIVVFGDEAGRFERLGTNRASRVLGHWAPSPGQSAEIAHGLQFNPRGSRSKTLRGSDAKRWSSGDAASGAGYRSAQILTYTETWQVAGSPEKPVFRIQEVLGGTIAEDLEGQTVFETLEVEPGGGVLSGRYARDGTQLGTFRMTRSGAPEKVRGSGKTQSERVRDLFFGEMAGQLSGDAVFGEEEARIRAMARSGELPEEVRTDVRRRFEKALEEQYRAQGNDPRAHQPQIESLALKMERLYLDEGRSLEEIGDLLRSGELRP